MSTVIRFYENGSPDVLKVESETVGQPGAGRVRLRHDAIGVNFIDTMFRTGGFQTPLPFVTGVEGAGVIEAVGPGVKDFAVGDRVAYFFAPGAYAEVRLISADVLLRLPDDISTVSAAAFITKGLTAWMAVRDLYPVSPGNTVLVQGATGGVGTIIARWAQSLGAQVIGTGSKGKLNRITDSVSHAYASDDPELLSRIRATAPSGVDVVYDLVGKSTFASTAGAVKDGGVIVNIGAASGPPAVDVIALENRKVRMIRNSTAQSVRGREALAVHELFDAYRRGVFGELEIARYPLRDAQKAHQDILTRSVRGSSILLP